MVSLPKQPDPPGLPDTLEYSLSDCKPTIKIDSICCIPLLPTDTVAHRIYSAEPILRSHFRFVFLVHNDERSLQDCLRLKGLDLMSCARREPSKWSQKRTVPAPFTSSPLAHPGSLSRNRRQLKLSYHWQKCWTRDSCGKLRT